MASVAPAVLPRLADAEWLVRGETRAVFAALAAAGFVTRVVGGAVRNALLGRPVVDIDMATTARPEAIIAAAKAAGLGAVPSGIEAPNACGGDACSETSAASNATCAARSLIPAAASTSARRAPDQRALPTAPDSRAADCAGVRGRRFTTSPTPGAGDPPPGSRWVPTMSSGSRLTSRATPSRHGRLTTRRGRAPSSASSSTAGRARWTCSTPSPS